MSLRNDYRFAQALLRFSKAWEELAAASKAVDNYDVSELYPFYLLDYEEIQSAVKAWCLHHASNLLKHVPDLVYNPACMDCPYMQTGIDPATGCCRGHSYKECVLHPLVMFSVDTVIPFLTRCGVDIDGLSPEAIQLLYVRKVVEHNESKTSHPATDSTVSDA